MHKARKAKLQAKSRNLGGKAIVLGMLERQGTVRATVVPDRTKPTIQETIVNHIEEGSEIFSDEFGGTWRHGDKYVHQIINHLEQYVKGNIHTNGMENFWSLLKRTLGGTYVSVEPFHLFRYVDEQAFRFNNRNDMSDADRFREVMNQIVGRRLTYKELTGKSDPATTQETSPEVQ